MLLQRLATSATGVKQARYRRGRSEALYAHAQYNTQPWHLLFNAWCNEFRRGFCTFSAFIVVVTEDLHLTVTVKVTETLPMLFRAVSM